ncbi:alpha/beta fold hydrolase [Sphingopyxis sp.]|uniref:alpha/beta fold hydrolase n=1 Tax=Sphingopyxis sp. TaxID=1908224 RepID=UPI002B46E715|nr:alpha/beta fold hydrolase [Sphingopyxis sp.]HJS12705.1 alpha/beta fold hydrolase [Sphingopyxis sp.]
MRAIDWEQAEAALHGGTMKLAHAAAEHADAALWTYVAAREALTWSCKRPARHDHSQQHDHPPPAAETGCPASAGRLPRARDRSARFRTDGHGGGGGAQAIVAFAGLYPQHCGRVVLVNPDPLSTRDDRRWGVLGSFKEAYMRRPELILPAARLISRAMTRSYLAKALRKAMRGSPPDEALLAGDDVIDDYYRAVRMFRAGHVEGYVREQAYFALNQAKDYAVDSRGWTVLIGAHDTLSDPGNTLSYWREILPPADFEIVKDHGRFLAYADPDLIVDRLLDQG